MYPLNIIDLLVVNNNTQLSSRFLIPCKKTVDLFQWHTFRLREEEVDDRNPHRIQHTKNDICPPFNIANRGRRDVYDDEVL